jgi:hypothetical protein
VAWSQEDIDRLKEAIGSGVLQVVYEGPPRRSITYQSTEAMLTALAQMEREVNGSTAFRYRRVQFRKGFRGVDTD